MSLYGADHQERFEQMKEDINFRTTEWRYFRSNKQPVSEDLLLIVEEMKDQFLTVGPFGSRFLKESKSRFKPAFYDIPLQHVFGDEQDDRFEGVAYVSTNPQSSVLMKALFDFLRNEQNYAAFADLELTAICMQLAKSPDGRMIVLSLECIERLRPLAFYEHPPNGRLLLAMDGYDYPDQSAMTFTGHRRHSKIGLKETLAEATNFYNEYTLDNIDNVKLTTSLYSFFSEE